MVDEYCLASPQKMKSGVSLQSIGERPFWYGFARRLSVLLHRQYGIIGNDTTGKLGSDNNHSTIQL
jgi:hypothetical protein